MLLLLRPLPPFNSRFVSQTAPPATPLVTQKKVWAFDDVFSVSRFRSRSEIFRISVIKKLIPTPGEVVRSLVKTRKKRPFLSFIGLFPLWILVCESPTEKTPPPKSFSRFSRIFAVLFLRRHHPINLSLASTVLHPVS